VNLAATIFIVLLISHLFAFLARKLKFPTVVGLLIAGLLTGIPCIKNIIIGHHSSFILDLGNIALICLMFLAGLESSWHQIYAEKKDALIIALFATLIPFLLGFGVGILLNFSPTTATIIGICISISAEATRAKVLLALKKLKTKVGSVMMGAGIIDDLFGLLLFILVFFFLGEPHLKENLFVMETILAFFVGIIVRKKMGQKSLWLKEFENSLNLIIIPFFFIAIGLHFDISSLALNPLTIVLITLVAFLGKLGGVLLVKPFLKFQWKQLYLIGWAMNSRGAIGIALAMIACASELISVELYSALIVMALLTTISFPFVITRMIKTNPKIMN